MNLKLFQNVETIFKKIIRKMIRKMMEIKA